MDFVDEERILSLKEKGKYVFIPGDKNVVMLETSSLVGENINPITGIKMSSDTILYILFHSSCYINTHHIDLDQCVLDECFSWYHNMRRKGKTFDEIRLSQQFKEKYNIVKYYLTPVDFQEHFRSFDPKDSNSEVYERDLAEKALINSGEIGSWLIRHSSKNRPESKDMQNYLNNFGIRYYAISYLESSSKIKHLLINKEVGVGWNFSDTEQFHTFTNFLECLEYILIIFDLKYSSRISVYVSPDYL
jgi:hypothetical protein